MSKHTTTEWNRHITPEGTQVTATHITDQQKIDALVEALKECQRYFRNRTGNHETQMVEVIGQALALAQQGTP